MAVVDPFSVPATASGEPIVDPFSAPQVDFSKIGEFDAKNATEGQKWRIALGYVTTPNVKSRVDIIRKVLPGSLIQVDPQTGRQVVTYKGESGFIDKPGVTLGGFVDGLAQVAKYIPVGQATGLVSGGLAKIGVAGLAGSAASVAEDTAAIPQGSKQGVDPERAAITGIASATGQAISPLIDKGAGWLADKGRAVWASLRGNPNAITANGTLTSIGRFYAKRAGLDPDQVTPQLVQQLEQAAKSATAAGLPDEQIPGAMSRQALGSRFKVPLTKGEITQDYGQQSLEENLKRMDVTTKAGNIMRNAEKQAAAAMRGESGESGFGLLRREVSGSGQIPTVSDAGQQVLAVTKAAGEADKALYGAAYKTAREAGTALDARAYKEFINGAEAVLKDSVDYDPNLFPQTAKMLENLRGRSSWMAEMGGSAPRQIPLAKLENLRKVINSVWKSADATDRMGLDVLRNQYDEMVNGALDSGRVVGDKNGIEAWKAGRALYGRFRSLYAPDKAAGSAEKQAGRIVENWLKSDNVTGDEVIRQAISNKALTQRILAINGEGSPAVTALKQGTLEYVFRPALKGEEISPRLIVSQFDRFFKGSNAEQMRSIFNANDLKAINEFVLLAKAKIPANGVINTSNTGNVMMKAIQQLGQKLGIISAASGNIGTAAALGAINAASGARATSQAASAVKGLVPASGSSAIPVAVAAGVGQSIATRDK